MAKLQHLSGPPVHLVEADRSAGHGGLRMAGGCRAAVAALWKGRRGLAENALAGLRARWCLRKASRLGAWVRVWGRPTVRLQAGRLVVAERVRLVSTLATLELDAVGGVLEIGAGTFINYGTSISARQSVYIGRDCNIGTHCDITDSAMLEAKTTGLALVPILAPVRLEDNVWLGARAIVQGGVTIGSGSVIGAGSVVTTDVPPRCLAVGVPACVIRQL